MVDQPSGGEADDQPLVEEADPDAAFAALTSDRRVAILRALWDADGPLSFSALREAVGRPDSGQFNYHLDRLVGRFATRTDAGYELTQAGMHLYGALQAGAYTAAGAVGPVTLAEPCPTCGGDRTFRYDAERVRVACGDCGLGHTFGVPPAALAAYDRAEVPAVAGRFLRTSVRRLNAGFCPYCDGQVRARVRTIEGPDLTNDGSDDGHEVEGEGERGDGASVPAEDLSDLPLVEYRCRGCGSAPTLGLTLALLDHPAVVSFHYHRGRDATDGSVWRFAGVDPDSQRVRSRDPFRAAVTYGADGDSLTLVVDDALDVVAVEE
jgi:hypothetical protein